MQSFRENEIKELDDELAQLMGKRLSVYVFSILLALGALAFFVLSIYLYREFYQPDRNIFDYSNFKRVWGPMFITIGIRLKLVIEAIVNIKVFLSKLKSTKEKRNTFKIS